MKKYLLLFLLFLMPLSVNALTSPTMWCEVFNGSVIGGTYQEFCYGANAIYPSNSLPLLIDGGLNVSDNISFHQLSNCDTINTDASGLLTCGDDGDTTYTADETNLTLVGTVFHLLSLDLAEHTNTLNWITTAVSTLTNYALTTSINDWISANSTADRDYTDTEILLVRTSVDDNSTYFNDSMKLYVDNSIPSINGTDINVLSINATKITVTENITHPSNPDWGIFNNGSCIVFGNLSYISECG